MSEEKTDSDRQEELESMLEEYNGPSVAEYVGENNSRSSTRVSNSLTPPENK